MVDSQAQCAFEPATPFLLTSRHETLLASGARSVVRPTHASWSSIHAAFAAGSRGDGAPLLVGALPFDHDHPAHLFQPLDVRRGPGDMRWGHRGWTAAPPAVPLTGDGRWHVTAEPTKAEYEAHVAAALARLATSDSPFDALRKVVLARSLVVRAPAPFDVRGILQRLRFDPDVTVFAVPLPASERGVRMLVGATPELLVDKRGGLVVSEPLAGSARRSSDAALDRDRAEQLRQSDKDRREHAAVVEWVADRLSPYCRDLRVPAVPSLAATRSMWHLATRLDGELRDETVSSIELAEALHPTPAVCGLPRDAARAAIRRFETFEREYFAGAVGWCDTRGDGRWLMSIRCADITGDVARLYAGAGIVAGSNPQAEAAETSGKFAALLDALGLDEDGHLQAGDGQ